MSGADEGMSTGVVIAVDSGGTFTDLLLFRDGALHALKVPSTPEDPTRAVLEGLRRLLGDGRPAGPQTGAGGALLIHGTTVATNAVLERKGARVGLVTNRGFEDVIEIGRQDRPQLYALVGHRAPPLVAVEDRVGIAGRLGPRGEEVEPMDARDLAGLGAALADVDSIAISLLHSYADPTHEEAVAQAVEAHRRGRPVSVSSRILPEFREFERTCTTVVNAFVAPRVSRYLERLRTEAGAREIRVMGSAGGALPLARAIEEPVATVLSGPAGGVAGALEHGRRIGRTRLLAFDMGGTSTDVSLIPDRLLSTREGRLGDHPVAIPLMDIHTVGAGGGSIAWLDAGGALRVGPESAGADPGPIGYGRGGRRVTVTDAHLWLGRLRPEGFLGGSTALDREAIRGPLGALAGAMGTSLVEAAEGVIEVANATMERALRVISVERGVDPSEFDLFSFGGAGGLHAAELAGRLGARSVLVPPDPGLASAWGMLAAPVVRDRARTLLLGSDLAEALPTVDAAVVELEELAREELAQAGLDPKGFVVSRRIDARYRGQSWELEVPAQGWVEAFHAAHHERYGYDRPGSVVEAVTARVRVEAPGLAPPSASSVQGEVDAHPLGTPGPPPFPGSEVPRSRPSPEGGPTPDRTVRVLGSRGEIEAALRWRHALDEGVLAGPAILLEYSSTLWIPPGWSVARLDGGILQLTRGD